MPKPLESSTLLLPSPLFQTLTCAESCLGHNAVEPFLNLKTLTEGNSTLMKKILFSILTASLLLPAVAEDKIPRQPSPKGAKVMIIFPRDGKTVKGPVRVAFGLKGMGVCPAGLVLPDGKPMPNTGHHHLLIDTEKMPRWVCRWLLRIH